MDQYPRMWRYWKEICLFGMLVQVKTALWINLRWCGESSCAPCVSIFPGSVPLHALSTSDQTNALNVLSVSSSLTSQTQPITQPLGKKTSPRSNPAFACMHLLSLSPPVPLTSSCYTYFCTLRDSTSAWHVKQGWNTAHEGKDKWEMCKHWGGKSVICASGGKIQQNCCILK